MPDRTEANPNELNQDDARYGFRCCHLKNIWTAPLPPETELSRQMTDRKSGSAGMPRPISYAVFCLKKKKTNRRRRTVRSLYGRLALQHASRRNCSARSVLTTPAHVPRE